MGDSGTGSRIGVTDPLFVAIKASEVFAIETLYEIGGQSCNI
jgi:hypothetical protein